MSTTQKDTKIAFLVAADGIERAELATPWTVLHREGYHPVLVSPEPGEVRTVARSRPAGRRPVDVLVADAHVDDYAALVLPGGLGSPDALRLDTDAVDLVRAFVEADKPVAASSHAPWLLVEADVVRGKRLTSWPSIATDIRNAGGRWVDEQVVEDPPLITSRAAGDIHAFDAAILAALAA